MLRKDVYALIEDHYKRRYREQVNMLRYGTGGHHNAEDTVQEAYTRACKYWDTYDEAKTFDAWFSTILSNCTRDKQRDVILNGMVQEAGIALGEPARLDPNDRIAVNEVIAKIQKLPKHVEYVLKMYLFFGYTSKEIAEFTDYKPDAIRQIVSRFRQEMSVA